MNIFEAKEIGFTHLAEFGGIECYIAFDENGGVNMQGTNRVRHFFINCFVRIEPFLNRITGKNFIFIEICEL